MVTAQCSEAVQISKDLVLFMQYYGPAKFSTWYIKN